MSPISGSDGHYGRRLFDEPVPSLAREFDDLVVGFEDLVGQPVVAQELPDVLHWVQFGRPWRQVEKRDVGRDLELAGAVPSGLIEDDDGVSAGADLG